MRFVLITVAFAAAFCLAGLPHAAQAQSDAEIALEKARTAFAAEQYAEARDLLITASQTDEQNPDIFLLLGKAHYQLGEIDKAVDAWQKTLKLAPAQAYARTMLDALQGRIVDVDVRMEVIQSLVNERLARTALQEIGSLRRGSLTDAQLSRLLSLEAEALIASGEFGFALKSLRELVIRDPQQADSAKVRLLTGKAKLAGSDDAVTEGQSMLAAVKADFADTPEAAAADLALISFRIDQAEDAVDELAAWIAAHGEHQDLHAAHLTMIRAVSVFIQESARLPKMDREDGLSDPDKIALKAARHAFASIRRASESASLAGQITKHVNNRMINAGAFETASEALKPLLDLSLPQASRQLIQATLAEANNAAAAETLTKIIVALAEGDETPATLQQWIGEHSEHPRATEARLALVNAYLQQSLRAGVVDYDADLSDVDKAAIAAAKEVVGLLKTSAEKSKLISSLLAHVKTRYTTRAAHQAAIAALDSLLQIQLPQAVRLMVMNQLVDTQSSAAMSRLEREVSAGTLQPGPLPADLVALMKTLETINTEFPAKPSWAKQASISAQLAAFSKRVEYPARVTQIKSTDDWALEFALPVIVANTDAKATESASGTVESIVQAAAAVNQKSARGLAARTHQRLLDALDEDHPLWPAAVIRQLGLRVADDGVVFRENTNEGRGQIAATFSDDQKAIFELASKLIARRPSKAAEVLTAVQPFLAARSTFGYDQVVSEAYAVLETDLPPSQLRQVRLTIAESTVNQVIEEHNRMLGNGFQPPEELDPRLQQALVQCYQLQSELEPHDAFVAPVQKVRETVITHYRNLRYHDAAVAAIAVAAETRVDWLDSLAEYQLAELNLSKAMEELVDQTKKFGGRENITLTPAVKEAIAGFEKFITEHPGDRLVSAAVGKILSVGSKYESYKKYDLAAEIYGNLETFASADDSLKVGLPNTPTVAHQAALSKATALHTKASATLKEAGSESDPPTQLSDEFEAAVAAYQAIITGYADSPIVSTAIGRIMEIALEHTSVDAWDVAGKVYADLQGQQLPLRKPERLDLAVALCELGKVMPDHARDVLAAITLWQNAVKDDALMDSMLAMNGPAAASPMSGGLGGGGFAGRPGEEMDQIAAAEVPMGAPAGLGNVDEMPADDPFGDVAPPTANETFRAESARATREKDLLAAVRRRQSAMATQVAMMRDKEIQQRDVIQQQEGQQKAPQQQTQQAAAPPVLSDAEIQRRQTVLVSAYEKFQAIRKTYAETDTATQARDQIMVIINHWRSIAQWERAAALVKRFLDDNPRDIDLPKLRHEIARDYLAWAAGTVKPNVPKQQLLDDVNSRFALARKELEGIIEAFDDNQSLKHQAQWDIAVSHLSQARVVAGISSTLARGQYVRAANELLQTADLYHDHPKINELPQMLWNIADELTSREFYDEAIAVWNEMTLHYPGNQFAEQAAMRIAQTYQNQLRLPLRAVESYLELNFARGGNDVALQDAIFRIASQLMSEHRWVESLHVLETFVDSFPKHASAGQALTMIGQVHQTNEVWEDAIAAYRRVILEYDQGNWAQQSKWSIAECTINLSRWAEAQGAYLEYQKAYPEDAKVAEATKRMEILKDLARYQKVVDEQGQRKAFDAQYQIASIVRNKLANPVKAIIEYKKVAERWPNSHLADDALFQVGMIYMQLSKTEDAREAFFATADRYPTSPLADDALFQVGASFEAEAQSLAGVTRGKASQIAAEAAQRRAYAVSQDNRRVRREQNVQQIAKLKKAGKKAEVERQTALHAALNVQFDQANASVVANWAAQQEEALTTAQLADRQDKINAALRKAVSNFRRAASVASADKADDALLRMAQIYDQRLKDSDAAMSTWLEIVKQYSGTAVAEDASWKIAKYYEEHEKYADAISAYNSFLRNYRRSPKASDAQAAIAENHEQLGNWVEAMDAYTNYINNYPEGTMATKAKEQIAWIKTYRL